MFTGLSPFATVYIFAPSGIESFVFTFFAGFGDSAGVAFASSCVLLEGLTALVDGIADSPCRLLIALKAMIPATATTCSRSTIKSARESFMFGSDRSSKAAPDAVARRVVAALNFFLREKILGKLIAFIWVRREQDAGIDRRDPRNF